MIKKLMVAAVALMAAGCSAQAVTSGATATSGASDVPPGWTTVTTPDANALAFRCSISAGTLTVTVWNISDVQEEAWHLIVPVFQGSQQLGTLDDGDYDIGDNWIQPQQKMTFTTPIDGPGTSCHVTGLA